MTEYEGIAMLKIKNHFYRQFSSLVGDCIAQMPEALEAEVLEDLQEICNVYTASYEKHLDIKRVNWGTKPTEALPSFLDI